MNQEASKTLLPISRRFFGLFWTQFFGALNDNVFKNALVVSVVFHSSNYSGAGSSLIVTLAGGLFILPFFLFSGVSGRLSDRFDKSKIARIVKWFELTIMSLAILGFYYQNFILLLFLLMLMGLHSTIFGPLKYSIIPDLVAAEELNSANGWVESATYLAILLGTILGGLAVSAEHEMIWLSTLLWGIAICGLAFSYFIPRVPPPQPELKIGFNIFSDIADSWRKAKQVNLVFQAVLAISWFWLLGSVVLSLLPVYVSQKLGAKEEVFMTFLTLFTLGIGVGSFISVVLSKKFNAAYLVVLGLVGMSVALADWAVVTDGLSSPTAGAALINFEEFKAMGSSWRIMLDLFFVAIAGGVYTLPLYTWMQQHSAPGERSRVVAANNILNAAFMVSGALGLMLAYRFHLEFHQIILILAAINFGWAAKYHFSLKK